MIVIGWSELPSYAIDCINSLNLKNKLVILTDNKKAKNLIKNADVKIINLSKKYSWQSIGVQNPKYFFFTGWNNKAFISLAKKKETKNICLIDNILKNNMRQFLGKFYFKFFLNRIFDAIFVPGENSKKFIKYLGFKKLIFDGLYTCNDRLFKYKKNILNRKFDFIYVGKFIKRKNLNTLISAFTKIKKIYKNSNLILVGGNKLKTKNGISVVPFTDSKKIAELMNNSKCLILPSFEEHWGVVVHEASCCGCLLILSDKVGCKKEFLKNNGYLFKPNNIDELYINMEKILNLNSKILIDKSFSSLQLSKQRSILNWKKQFSKIVENLN